MTDYKLWEISNAYAALDRMLDDATDPDEIEAIHTHLEELNEDFSEKTKQCVHLLDAWESQMIGLDEMIRRLSDRRKTLNNRWVRLREYLKREMQATGKQEIAIDHGRAVRLRVNPPSVQIDDVSKIPREFFRYPEPQPDKAKIKQALRDDDSAISGCSLVRTTRLEVE